MGIKTDLAIAVVTSVINDLVGTATEAGVSNHSPAVPPSEGTPCTAIYLYQVLQNPRWINQDLPTRRSDGSLTQKPRIALDLNYLFSFFGKDAELVPQRLMGAALRALHARPIISREHISAVIQAHEQLNVYDPGECFESIRISPLSLNLEEMSKLWSIFFQKPYALSAAYQATVVLIETEETPSKALPVYYPEVYVLPLHKPYIEQVEVKIETEQTEAEIGGPWIFTNSTIVITGRDLLGEVTKLRIGELEAPLVPNAGDRIVTDDHIVFNLSDLPDLQAGVSGIQVVHTIEMGRPKEPRSVIESNVAAMVLHPRIDENPIPVYQEPPAPPLIRVKTSHPVGIKQRVTVLLNHLEKRGGFSCPASPRYEITDLIDFPAPGLEAGRYLARIQVDGAESEVKYDTDPQSPLVVVYGIREDGVDQPKYDAAAQKLTLTIDPAMKDGQTAEVTVEKAENGSPLTAQSDAVIGESHEVVFRFSASIETGRYRIKLTIASVEAINRPEMNIS